MGPERIRPPPFKDLRQMRSARPASGGSGGSLFSRRFSRSGKILRGDRLKNHKASVGKKKKAPARPVAKAGQAPGRAHEPGKRDGAENRRPLYHEHDIRAETGNSLRFQPGFPELSRARHSGKIHSHFRERGAQRIGSGVFRETSTCMEEICLKTGILMHLTAAPPRPRQQGRRLREPLSRR